MVFEVVILMMMMRKKFILQSIFGKRISIRPSKYPVEVQLEIPFGSDCELR
jgi:hypothetical protein